MFICGDDAESTEKTRQAARSVRWETADLGAVRAARAIEPMCRIWGNPRHAKGDWSPHGFKADSGEAGDAGSAKFWTTPDHALRSQAIACFALTNKRRANVRLQHLLPLWSAAGQVKRIDCVGVFTLKRL